jgi:hypothetical protein
MVVVDEEYNNLRHHVSRLNNATSVTQAREAYDMALLLRSCSPRIQEAAARLGVLPALVALLMDSRPRVVSNAAYAVGFLMRNCPENQVAARSAAVLPLLIMAAKSPEQHTQCRALCALQHACTGCPENAVVARTSGLVPLVLDVMRHPASTWTLKGMGAAVVCALAGADAVSRQLFIESDVRDTFSDMLFVCTKRTVHGRVKVSVGPALCCSNGGL